MDQSPAENRNFTLRFIPRPMQHPENCKSCSITPHASTFNPYKLKYTLALPSDLSSLTCNFVTAKPKATPTISSTISEGSTSDNSNYDVVIVGGGPGGLWVANQMKIRNPKLNIVVLEKRAQYVRTQPIKLKHDSLFGMPDHPRLNQIRDTFKKKKLIPINEIENELKMLATDLKVDIRLDHVTHPEDLHLRFPNAKFFIGADGAHSIVRKEIFKGQLSFEKNLQYLIEVKYDVCGNSQQLPHKMGSLKAQKWIQTLVSEDVTKEKNGKSTVRLRFFVDGAIYEKMKQARFANPYTFASHEHLIPEQLRTRIRAWMNIRESTLGEKRIEGSETITSIALDMYATQTFVKQGSKPGTTWSLIGDAAIGLPFFRSLNTTFLSGTQLAKAISNADTPLNPFYTRCIVPILRWIAGSSVEGNVPDSLVSFAAYIRTLSHLEAASARVKSIAIHILRKLTKIDLSFKKPYGPGSFSLPEGKLLPQ